MNVSGRRKKLIDLLEVAENEENEMKKFEQKIKERCSKGEGVERVLDSQ